MHRLTVLIDLLDDLIQLLSRRVLAQHPHHGTQLLGADITATVGVKHVECGLELWKKFGRKNRRYFLVLYTCLSSKGAPSDRKRQEVELLL